MDPQKSMEIIYDETFLSAPAEQRKQSQNDESSSNFAAGFLLSMMMIAGCAMIALLKEITNNNELSAFSFFAFPLLLVLLIADLVSLINSITHFSEFRASLNTWRTSAQDFFCPRCCVHMPTLMAYVCPRCGTVNGGDANTSYFLDCRHCHHNQDAILCPRCNRTIALVAKDKPIRCIAVPTNRQPH